MKKQAGFTLIELMVSIAIIGILIATAYPAFNAYRERARSAEAFLMIKQIMDAQIAYYLEKETFYPPIGEDISILHDTPPNDQKIKDIYTHLNIRIQPGRFLEYYLRTMPDANGKIIFYLIVASKDCNFSLAKGLAMITYTLDEDGKISDEPFGL